MAAGTIEIHSMSNLDKHTYSKFETWEEIPDMRCWNHIREELDRLQISQRVISYEEIPQTTLASSGSQQNAARHKRWIRFAALTPVLLLLIWLTQKTLLEPAPNTSAPASAQLMEPKSPVPDAPDQKTPSSSLLPVSEKLPQQPNPTPITRSQPPEPDYVWVAGEQGVPMRVPLRWEALSCCLSGETETTECNSQRELWHYEVLQTNLGFQADPFLGLVALLDFPQNP